MNYQNPFQTFNTLQNLLEPGKPSKTHFKIKHFTTSQNELILTNCVDSKPVTFVTTIFFELSRKSHRVFS